MWHPWKALSRDHPEWHVAFVAMPPGKLGGVSVTDKIIWVDKSLGQVDRRWVAAHEIVHMERGHDGPCNARVECSVSSEAARRLIDIEDLAEAAAWTSTLFELAAELWVPPSVVAIRMDHLHPAERAYLNRVVANRDDSC